MVAVEIDRTEGEYAWTWECNTTPDGAPYYYRRHYSLFTAVGLPRYTDETPTVDTDLRRDLQRVGGFATAHLGA